MREDKYKNKLRRKIEKQIRTEHVDETVSGFRDPSIPAYIFAFAGTIAIILALLI